MRRGKAEAAGEVRPGGARWERAAACRRGCLTVRVTYTGDADAAATSMRPAVENKGESVVSRQQSRRHAVSKAGAVVS